MSDSNKQREFGIAFVVTEQILREAVALIDARTSLPAGSLFGPDKITYIAELVEGGRLLTNDLEEIIQLPNSGQKEIRGIEVSTAIGVRPSVRLRSRNSRYLGAASYDVTGDEDSTYLLDGQLQELVNRTRQWYSWVVRRGAGWIISLCIISFSLAAVVGAWVSSLQNTGSVTFLGAVAALGSVAACGFLLGRIERWLLPIAQFSMADGIDRANRLQRWRWFVGATLLATLIVGFIASFAANLVTKW